MCWLITGHVHWGDPGNYAYGIITRDAGPGPWKPRQLLQPPKNLFALHLSFVTWGLMTIVMWSSVWIWWELPRKEKHLCCPAGSCGSCLYLSRLILKSYEIWPMLVLWVNIWLSLRLTLGAQCRGIRARTGQAVTCSIIIIRGTLSTSLRTSFVYTVTHFAALFMMEYSHMLKEPIKNRILCFGHKSPIAVIATLLSNNFNSRFHNIDETCQHKCQFVKQWAIFTLIVSTPHKTEWCCLSSSLLPSIWKTKLTLAVLSSLK